MHNRYVLIGQPYAAAYTVVKDKRVEAVEEASKTQTFLVLDVGCWLFYRRVDELKGAGCCGSQL